MIELSHEDSQIVLYAKGHFVQQDRMTDIKTILAKRSGIPFDSITDQDVIIVLMGLLEDMHLERKVMQADFMSQIINGMRYGMKDMSKSPIERFVIAVMGILSGVQVLDVKDDETITLVKMAGADPDYLPVFTRKCRVLPT